MRLSAFHQDANAIVNALSCPDYLLHDGEGRLQGAGKQPVHLPSSTSVCLNLDDMVLRDFANVDQHFHDVSQIYQRAILTTRNERLHCLNILISARIPVIIKKFENTDPVGKTEINKLNYSIELLNAIHGSLSLSEHQPTL